MRWPGLKSLLLAVATLVILLPSSAAAISEDQKSVLSEGVYYFNTAASTQCTVDVSTSLSGNNNIQMAYNFFVGRGLTPEQASGIVGNFWWESTVDPTKDNGGGDSDAPIVGKAWGIAQWTDVRLYGVDGLINYAKNGSLNIDDLSTQLNFAWHELSEGGQTKTLGYLKQVTGSGPDAVNSASDVIFNSYEGAGDSTGPDRQTRSQAVYKLYGDSTDGTTVTTTASGGDCSSSSGPGQDTQYIDGFTTYSQCDPTWKDKPYGSGGSDAGCSAANTIGADGCGPTAMAMIISTLTGKQVTPDQTAAYATSQNLYESGVGSDWSIAPKMATRWGLTSTPVDASVSAISAALQAGNLVIVAGTGSEPFTGGGHFIVIRGVTADGQWQIGDPGNPGNDSKTWSPDDIVTTINSPNSNSSGSAYAIGK